MPIKREELAKQIADRLNVLANQLKTRSRASFTDANHSLEFVMARFFNALFAWNLTDLNAVQANFPAADLGDRARRIAMQITNEESSQKISGTATKAAEHRLGQHFDRLIIFFLLPRKPGLPKKFARPHGASEIECWDLTDLLKQMTNLPDVSALAAAAKVLDEELGNTPAALSTLHTLPPNPLHAGFVGRTTDLAKLRALNPAAGAHLTGLRGMGGIGKTALAVVLAHEWAPRFPDAQFFLDARGTQPDPPSAGKLMEQVILAFHPTAKLPDDPAAIAGIYRDVLGGKQVLLLLDNARDATQAAPLIPPAGCALIVTSRHSFMLGKTAPHDVGRLPAAEAVALLREYHGALGDAEAAALVKLCAGLPLALRLAGAHLALDAAERGGTPDVAGYLKLLGGGRLQHLDAEAAEAGEVTISETLRLSEAQLAEAERAAWRALGVFTASFDARAAAAVARPEVARHSSVETQPADSTLECRATEMLGHFVRRSLLEREGAERFKVHDLAADYARTQLDNPARTALHLAHARHYTAVGDEADTIYMKGDAVGGLALFDRERAQLEAAYAWLDAEVGRGVLTAPPPGRAALPRGRGNEVGDASASSWRGEDNPPYLAAARQLLDLVNAVVYTGQELRFHPRQRIAWLESQLRAARLAKHREAEGSALGNLGLAHADLGDARKAIAYHEQALVVSREIGDRRGEGNALGNLGSAHFALGDARKAIEFYEQQLVIVREIGNRRGEGNALGNLGSAHVALGNARKAIEFYEQRLVIAREIGDRRGEGNALGNLGIAHKNVGDARKAIEFYEQHAGIAREIGDRRGEGNALFNSAVAHDSLGNRPEAIARAAAALAIYEAIESPAAAQVRATLAKWRG